MRICFGWKNHIERGQICLSSCLTLHDSSGVRVSTFVVEGISYWMCKTEKNLGKMLCARTLLPFILHGRCSLPGWLSRGEVLGGYHVLSDIELLEVGLLRGWNPLVVQCKVA